MIEYSLVNFTAGKIHTLRSPLIDTHTCILWCVTILGDCFVTPKSVRAPLRLHAIIPNHP